LTENEDSEIEEMMPWYKGFIGKIVKVETNKWTTHGLYEVKGNKIIITELPIGTWTEDYKIFLDKLETEEIIYSYKNNSTDTTIHFELSLSLENIIQWTNNAEIEKKLKLMSHISGKNMYVFDENDKIVKMESAEEIIFRFWKIRNEYYLKRQKYTINKIKCELDVITSKIKFIDDVIHENIKVFRQTLEFINSQLETKEYSKIENSYRYLTDMKIHSFSKDTIDTLTEKMKTLSDEYTKILNMKLKDFWNDV
jgi:DNA topoisomerase-2